MNRLPHKLDDSLKNGIQGMSSLSGYSEQKYIKQIFETNINTQCVLAFGVFPEEIHA
jgi:hypothetical protein